MHECAQKTILRAWKSVPANIKFVEPRQLHTSHAISQEQYSIWSWLLVHLCRMMISPEGFFNFGKVRGVKGQKIAQNEK